ncbi:CHAT domain-containing protein [Nostoc favosum]|uniref:CHAT domain-containing protein n=1 Tax=Nostoc favosum CHAB5714 TaxID=2780399 RepID=A0ABS8IHY3_9NOSO|nr:CHAT domain-containing protein [Nostoc favosum]MCC5603887.1 CHAT domain-containing protein [Nostoc favosum CHAB5714]
MNKKKQRGRCLRGATPTLKARFFSQISHYKSRLYSSQVRSLILVVLLFFLSVGGVLVTTQVWASTAIGQTQQEPLQLVKQAKSLYQNRQFESALTVWEQVAAAFAAREDKLNQAMALSNLALTSQQLGRWEQAKKAIATSLNILQTQPKTPQRASEGGAALTQILSSTLDIQGQLQLAVGESEAALATWKQAAEIYQNLGNQNGAIRSQINQTQAMQDLGLYPMACKTLLKTLELDHQNCQITKEELQTLKERFVNKENSSSLDILALRSLGNVLRVVSQLEQSQMVLFAAGQLAQQSGDSQNLAAIYLSLGNTARSLGNRKIQLGKPSEQQPALTQSICIQAASITNAAQFYQQAATCYRQAESSTSSDIKRQAQLNRFSLLVQTQQWSEVPTLLSEITSHLNDLPITHPTVYAHIKFAQSLMCLQSGLSENSSNALSSPILQLCSFVKNTPTGTGVKTLESSKIPSWPEIGQILQTALNQAQQLQDKQAEADVRGYLGGVYQQMGKLTEARQLTEQALQQKSAFNDSSITYLWQWQLGRIYQTQQNQKSALQAYTLAYETLQSLRKDLVGINPEIQFTFRDSVEPVYRELVNLLLQPQASQQIKQTEINQKNLKQARDVIEALQLAELTNFFREACITSQPQPIDQVDPNAAVIYSIILPDRLAVILSRPQKDLKYYATPLKPSSQPGEVGEVERVYDNMLAGFTRNIYSSNLDSLRPQQIFYDWLIRPIEAELEKDDIKTLVFVLDGVLRAVPMSALYDSQKQKYLIEKYNLALSPGLQLLYSASLSPNKLQTLVGGLAEARQGFSKLPGVEQEVQEITKIVPTEVLLNQEFTRSRLKVQINNVPFPIVHLATHGQFSSQAENTFLLTWDGRINVKELDQLLQGRDRPGRSPLELLILSACQTAAGDNRAILGLAGVAVRSGARSTLATLWSVEDESTVELMNKFYSELNQPGVTKAEALRQAQLFLLRSPNYHRPYYWAPFVLVGNWL